MATLVPYITSTILGQLSAIPASILAQLMALDAGATVNAQILATCALMNGYIGPRYPLPLTSVGLDIQQSCADLTAWRLMSKYGFRAEGNDEDFRERYNDAMGWLKDVSRGSVQLDAVTADPVDLTLESIVVSQTPRGWSDAYNAPRAGISSGCRCDDSE